MPEKDVVTNPFKMIPLAISLYKDHIRALIVYAVFKYIGATATIIVVLILHIILSMLVFGQSDARVTITSLLFLIIVPLVQVWYGYYFNLKIEHIFFDIVEDKVKNPTLTQLFKHLKLGDKNAHVLSSRYRKNSILTWIIDLGKPFTAFSSNAYDFNLEQRNNFAIQAYPYWLYTHPNSTFQPQNVPFSDEDNEHINSYINKKGTASFILGLMLIGVFLLCYTLINILLFPIFKPLLSIQSPFDWHLYNFLSNSSGENIQSSIYFFIYRLILVSCFFIITSPIHTCYEYFHSKYIISKFYKHTQ